MIDIVFQLLIFFILTFKVVAPEGQFNIKMPDPTAPSQDQADMQDSIPPLSVRLEANDRGDLKQILMGSRELGTDMGALETELAEAQVMGIGVEIDAAKKLKFNYLMAAIDICAKLNITNIKFAPEAKSS